MRLAVWIQALGLFLPAICLFVLNLLGIEASQELLWALAGMGSQAAMGTFGQAVSERRTTRRLREIQRSGIHKAVSPESVE